MGKSGAQLDIRGKIGRSQAVAATRPGGLCTSASLLALLVVGLHGGGPILGLVGLVGACLVTAGVTHRSLVRQANPCTRLRLAADTKLAAGCYDQARVLYQRSLAAARRDGQARNEEVLVNYYSLAAVHALLREHPQADAYLYKLLEGLDHRVPEPWAGHVAWLMRKVAQYHSLEGRHEYAIDLCRRALALVGEAPGADDCTVRSLLDDLGWIYHHAGDYDAAESLFRRALALHEQYLETIVEEHLRANALERACDSPYRVAGPAASTTSGGLERATAYSALGLGWTLFEQGRVVEAREAFERAAVASAGLRAGVFSGAHVRLRVEVLRGRAAVEMAVGCYDGAARLYERARALCAGSDALRYAALSIDLGWLARCQDRLEQAEAIYRDVAEVLGEHGPSANALLCALHESVADLKRRQGRLKDAGRASERALALAYRCLGPEHPRYAAIVATAARVFAARCEYVEAERCARRSLQVFRLAFGADHPRLADGYVALGEVHIARGQFGAAEQVLARALWLREQAYGPDHPELVEVLEANVSVLRATHRIHEADALLDRVQRLRKLAVAA